MKRRFTEEQIIGILKEAEGGRQVKDVIREHGISQDTFYRWRRKFGGLFKSPQALELSRCRLGLLR